ncbi:MAG: hypothetical protein K2P81_05515 [Bacteriovoracaceae bacterium]|nr:hypothetical protein [Bacteriovoracaceae bacterium]
MKTLFSFALVLFSTATFASSTLLSFSTSVYFAPAEMRGTSGVKVLDTGAVVAFNNKGVETELAQLSADVLSTLEAKVKALRSTKLQGEEGPRCMDAPSTKIEITKPSGKSVVIYQRVGCRDSEVSGGSELIEFARAMSSIKSFHQ